MSQASSSQIRKPEWLKVRAPGGDSFLRIKDELRSLKLHTVCEEARCPNLGECWSVGTATIMVLGDVCTRGCKFCAIKTGNPRGVVDENEPEKVAGLIAQSHLEYVVLTSVDRDDLADQGAGHFARTVENIKRLAPHILVETLVPDFSGVTDCVETLVNSGVDVFAHNVETVERLQKKVRDPRAGYKQSLLVLKHAKEFFESKSLKVVDDTGVRPIEAPRKFLTKTSIMLGLGETYDEIHQTLKDLREHAVDVVTFGQYLQPTKRHLKVEAYVSPEQFDHWAGVARDLGFAYVASGPLVRSSYKAGEYFLSNLLKTKEPLNHG